MALQQRQQGGDNSTNFQAEVVHFHQSGVSIADPRGIAQDVYKANALEMAGLARSVAAERCEEWSEKFLMKLSKVSPALLAALMDPDIQHSLFSAQRDFARSGDDQLGDALADLLVLRCRTEPNSFTKVVLNEAIATLPKLTHAQVDILSLIWTLTRTYEPTVTEPAHLSTLWSRVIGPLLTDIPTSRSHIEHLSYAGCLTIGISGTSIWHLAMRTYGQLFSQGVSEEVIPGLLTNFWNDERVFKPCQRDSSLKRAAQEAEIFVEGTVLTDNEEYELRKLRDGNYLQQSEFVNEMSTGFPAIQNLCDVWDKSAMSAADLSTVGIAIAHSNARRFGGPEDDSPLEEWLKV
ncbi:LPO_1073/Vpar_1526 family protein [Arthrobacter sp. NPDC058127]|uniref:LPO_1073/Vpar_1526 family protein n=1 Tax=Arthrobacter sp. NPDC058127 TaxID=3346351 RepID=UPI0036E1D09E